MCTRLVSASVRASLRPLLLGVTTGTQSNLMTLPNMTRNPTPIVPVSTELNQILGNNDKSVRSNEEMTCLYVIPNT